MKTRFLPLAVLVSLMLLSGCGQKEYHMPPPAQKSAEQTFIEEMAAKSGGDINKLTPAEVQKLDQITRGNGKVALEAAAKGAKQ